MSPAQANTDILVSYSAKDARWLSPLWATLLVNNWLEHLAAEGYGGVQRAFGWSFVDESSAGTASADLFIAEAVAWFGYSDPLPGSTWARGELLASLIGSVPTLLVLDVTDPQTAGHAWSGRPTHQRLRGDDVLSRTACCRQRAPGG